MRTWNYKIDTEGKRLREMIHGEETTSNSMRILYQIVACLESLENKLSAEDKEIWEDDIRDLCSEINEEVELIDEDDYESAKDTVNSWLGEFYDFCDSINCWVGI